MRPGPITTKSFLYPGVGRHAALRGLVHRHGLISTLSASCRTPDWWDDFLGRGDQVINGTAKADFLFGARGSDTISGGRGDDILDGGRGVDILKGGDGNDTYIVDDVRDKATDVDEGGTDTVISSASYSLSSNIENLTLTGTKALRGTGNDLDNTLLGNAGGNSLNGGAGDDKLYGGFGKDTLTGGDGNDTLIGGAHNDRLNGGEGNDTLWGGLGKDLLTGGLGSDVFVYRTAGESGRLGSDTITDFSSNDDDRIDISDIDAVSRNGPNKNDTFTFIGTEKFHGTAGELRYETKGSDTFVYGDTNGDEAADFTIHLDHAVELAKGDFIL